MRLILLLHFHKADLKNVMPADGFSWIKAKTTAGSGVICKPAEVLIRQNGIITGKKG